MTNDFAFLLSYGFVPIIKHDQASFTFLEEVARAASVRLLGEEVACHALRSEKLNAYVVRTPNGFFIGVTDTLLQDMSFDILDLLRQSSVAEFLASECAYPYDINAVAPTRGTLEASIAAQEAGTPLLDLDNPTIGLFNSIFEGMITFLLLHEIAHIKHNHLNLTAPGATFCELPETSAETVDGARLDKEREADSAASFSLAQVVISQFQAHPSAGPNDYLLILGCTFLGAIVTLRRTAWPTGPQTSPATHPLSQERILNIALWFSMTAHNLNILPAQQHSDFLYRAVLAVEKAARALKWPVVDWDESHFRPFLGR
jgi:hypothetical protein